MCPPPPPFGGTHSSPGCRGLPGNAIAVVMGSSPSCRWWVTAAMSSPEHPACGGPSGRPATTSPDGRARAQAHTAARDRQQGRGLGVDQPGAGGPLRQLRAGQHRRRLAPQHRGRGVRRVAGLLRCVRRRARPRPGHRPQPRRPARSPPPARVSLGLGQRLPRRARDGSRVKGMVFPGDLVWDDDPPSRANAGLVGKGR